MHLIIIFMRRLFVLLIISLILLTSGCGGSGSSQNPVASATTLKILSISPQSGGAGTLVTLQGSGFGTVQGASVVSYAGVTVVPNSWSDNVITVVIPATSQTSGSFLVTVAGVTSNSSVQFTISNPILSGVSPASGNPGTQVTLTGQYFGTKQGSSYVAFNGQVATIVTWSETTITCVVPTPSSYQSGTVSVVVWVDGTRQSNTTSFNLTVPTISNISPTADNIGATITISGSGFGTTQSQSSGYVTIGGQIATVVSWSENSIQVKVPQVSAAGAQNVIVSINGKQSSPSTFKVEGPSLVSFNPNPAKENETVTIYGNYLGTSQNEGLSTIAITATDHGTISLTPTSWYDGYIQFTCPAWGAVFSNPTAQVTVTVGGLSSTLQITID